MTDIFGRIEQLGHEYLADKPTIMKNAGTWVFHTIFAAFIILVAAAIFWGLEAIIPRLSDPWVLGWVGASVFYIVREFMQHRSKMSDVFFKLDPLMDWVCPVVLNGAWVLYFT
jgi:hypothetical protein